MTEHVRYFTPQWQPAPEPRGVSDGAPRTGGRILLFTTDDSVERGVRQALTRREARATLDVVRTAEQLVPELNRGPLPDRVLIWRTPGDGPDAVEAGEREYFLLQDLTQELLRARPDHDVQLVHAYVEDEADSGSVPPEYAAVAGLARVVRLEKPTFRYRGVALSARPLDDAAQTLLAEFDHGDEAAEVRYDGARRMVRSLRALPEPTPAASDSLPVRARGTYLITGGMGGLGLVFARELVRRGPVQLVLSGRRPLGDHERAVLAELTDQGSLARYVSADVSTPDGVAALVSEVRGTYGPLAGVLHSAGVIRDSFLLKKTREEAEAVLAAKVRGTRLLDEALSQEPLDFFVLFSSLAGTLGNLGQADYGFANAYVDHYARQRDRMRLRGLRSGASLAVGWPLWEESGSMRAADGAEDRARDALGLHPLTREEGVAALFGALACQTPQVVVIKGEPRTWELLLDGPRPAAPPVPEQTPAPAPATGEQTDPVLVARTREHLLRLVSRSAKLPASEIRTDASFGRYGIESIMIIGMIEELEGELGPLTKTLFFEYDSVDELAAHLAHVKGPELRARFGLERSPATPGATAPAGQQEPPAAAAKPLSGKWALLQAQARGRAGQDQPATEPSHPGEQAREEDQDIAVIGLAGRYPQAEDLDAFWRNLSAGTDSVTEIPPRRWDHAPFFDPEKGKPGRSYSRWGGFLDGVELFDPLFFGISPAEAEYLDPQERLFLETSWQVIEDAGYAAGALAGKKVGVFAGVMFGLYQLLASDKHGGWLNGNSSYASVANRVSYYFDFHGPSMTVDTMCSSSLVAIHQACASIRSGESELALAGGVNVMSHPAKYVQLAQGGFLSADGRCRAFGEGGDGYVPGEGVGAVLLKPLRRALADGDHVHAVIKGSAVNSGGRTSGYSVPNPQAQAEVIGDALASANVDPRSVSYVEAHGTGTSLGDPIEITGLTKAYGATEDRQFCAIGSVKSNIGHLESAAGIAALTKVILQMRHQRLVPSLHTTTLNPLIDFERTPFTVQRESREWEPGTAADGRPLPRRAAVSAFGAGGTNAHLVLEEAPVRHEPTPETTREQLLVFSARHEEGLRAVVERLLARLHRDEQAPPAPVAPVAQTGSTLTREGVRQQVREVVATALGLLPSDVDDEESYLDQGLEAFELAACHEELQERLGLSFPVGVLHEEPSIARTAAHLAQSSAAAPAPASVSEPAGEDTDAQAPLSLVDLAYTLQIGREAMDARLAVRASDLNDLREGLRAYLDGHRDTPGIWHGTAEDHDRRLHSLLRHDVTQKYTRQLLTEGRLDEAAEMWVMGAEVDWATAWSQERPSRLPLPTYPFEREVTWILPVEPDGPLVPASALPAALVQPSAPGQSAAPGSAPSAPAPQTPDTGHTVRTNAPEPTGEELRKVVLEDLRGRFSQVLQIPLDRLKARTAFEDFGVDSIRIAQLNRVLEQGYGSLPTSLLFTYKDLESLAGHLASTGRLPAHASSTQVEKADVGSAPEPVASVSADATESVGDIAIVGLSGRYPQAATLADFAASLAAGDDCVSEIPAERWDYRDFPDVACRRGGFLDDALTFDPGFFNLSPNAAAYMDPQERLFVQSVWHCLEDAGYTPEALADPTAGDRRGNVAVFAGVTFNEYGLYGAAELASGKDMPIDSQLYSVANRISYLLNLRGPSLVVDTACSSSLYAIHLACEALRHGEAEAAIAGGVNLSLHPSKYLTLGMFNFLSPDGHCKSFGEGGDGYVPGEGVGAVLLKPLRQAVADGDHIHGVIKGSAVNHGGKTNGYTVPNPVAQAEVVRTALTRAGVEPGGISYLEAHGTGTSLGDTIEIEALATAFDGFPQDGRHCAIGSVKSNIGHLEAAAGISQLTKVLLQMRQGRLFPSRLNSERLNPEIDFSRTPFRVQLSEEPWEPAQGQPRRAGISSFGVGGVNVHVVLEEYTAPSRAEVTDAGPWLVPLTARNPEALHRHAEELLAFLVRAGREAPALPDVAFTLQTGRRHLPCRIAFQVRNHTELAAHLREFVAEGQTDAAVERLEDLGRRWMDGEDVLFHDLWEGRPGHRTPLPGYPFEKETYWLYQSPIRAAVVASGETAAPATATPEGGPDADGVDRGFLAHLAGAFPKERPELMAAYLQRQVAELLGFTEGRLPETDRGFFELGMDSITSTQMHNLLEQLFAQDLDLQLFFNYPSILEVADYILGLLNLEGGTGTAPSPTQSPAPKTPEEDAPVWLFTRDWAEADAPQKADADRTKGAVLLFDTGKQTRSALTSLPADSRPERVLLVRPGSEGFRVVGEDEFELDPLDPGGYEELLETLADRDVSVERILHCWSVAGSEPDPERIESGLHHGVYALTALSQALLAKLPGRQVRLLYSFSTRNGVAAPENRGLGGFMRAARMENPQLVYKTVEFTKTKLSRTRMAAALMAEFDRPDEDVELRHDGKRRWTRCVRPVPAGQIEAAEPRFSVGGVYLLTGGPGGLAGLFARHLCQEYQAKVVLVGRREADPERLAELESWSVDGAEALYLRADIGDRQAVADLVAQVKSRYGNISGVIHAAGALRDGSLQHKRPEEMAEVFRAKVFGTRYLDEELRDEPLECFVMFSSLAAVLGNFGQSDYCFANGYLDAFALYREKLRERGQRSGASFSLNWSFWRTGGMETSEAILTWMRNRLGTVVFEGPEGWNALRTCVGLDHPQIVTVKGDIAKISRLMGVPESDIDTTLPLEPSTEPSRVGAAEGASAREVAPVVETTESDIDGMGEDELVALLRKEIELSENEGADAS